MNIKIFVIDPLSRPESTNHREAMIGRLVRQYTSIRKRPTVEHIINRICTKLISDDVSLLMETAMVYPDIFLADLGIICQQC